MPASFPYQPLDISVDSIRLLKLDGDLSSDNLQCELTHTTFASKPKYDALSYTWGSPDLVKTININGHEVEIRENLYWALFNLRRRMSQRLFWIDAICVNQDDLEERNRQVSLMAFIYSRAQTVLVWLGRPTMTPSEMNMYQTKLREELIYKLRDVDYWRRVWIVQEIGLARKISCFYEFRAQTIVEDWESFMMTMGERVSRAREEEKSMLPLKLRRHREGRHGDLNILERLLESFADAECQEPRDKIYGFLGLAHDCQDKSLKVDYSKSFFDLYEEVICFQQSAKPLEDPFPLDIDRTMRLVSFSSLLQLMLEGKVDNEIAIRSPTLEYYNLKSRTLTFTARGLIQGLIAHLGPSYSDAVSSFECERRWKATFERYYKSPDSLSLLREQDEDYTSKLLDMSETDLAKICSFKGPLYSYSRPDLNILFNVDWLTNGRRKEQVGFGLESIRSIPETAPIEEPHRSDEPRRFLGSDRFMGLVPADARLGDRICRFWGCDIAVVLRSVPNRGFQIVGRADISTPWERTEQRPGRRKGIPIEYQVGGVVLITMDIFTLQKLTR